MVDIGNLLEYDEAVRRRYFENLEQVRVYVDHVEKRMHNYLDSLSTEKLQKPYKIKGHDGKTGKITAGHVLIHMFEEEVHHRGTERPPLANGH